MKLEPYQIPESFQSYIEQFRNDPDTAITRLENHIQKRKTGAIGFFFLAWLYQQNDQNDKAVDAAVQARILAPGSKYLEKLPYFLSHPDRFEAWEPASETFNFNATHSKKENEFSHPINDIDLLISKLSGAERKRIKPDLKKDNDVDLGAESAHVDDIVTETLAVIHEKQQNYKSAIKTYEKLKRNNPEREEHFNNQIERLKDKVSEGE